MKKILYTVLVLGLLALIPLTGCGGGSGGEAEKAAPPDDPIRTAAENFMNAMQEGDLAGIKEYADPALFEEGGALSSFGMLEDIDKQFAEAVGVEEDQLSDKAKAGVQEFMDTILSNLVKSYEIKDVKEEGGVGKVSITTTFGFDPNKMEDVDINDDLEQMATDYMTNHMDELMQIYNDGGEQAMMSKVIDDLMGDILKKYADAVMETGEVSQDSVLTLEEKEGKWLVTNEEEAAE